MKLWCLDLDTKKKWGQQLYRAAKARKIDASLFTHANEIDEAGYAFMRVPQWPPQIQRGKGIAYALVGLDGLTLIPDYQTIAVYDDKLAQAVSYRGWLPETIVLPRGAGPTEFEWFRKKGVDMLPVVSKAAEGSASQNVRLLKTEADLAAEIEAIRSHKGLPMKIYGQDYTQHGYLIWQKFLPGNMYDYRVHVIGRHKAICRRWCPEGSVFASGVGRIENIDPASDEAQEVLAFCQRFFDEHGIKFAAVDVVRGEDGLYLLETSLGWSADKRPWLTRQFDTGASCSEWLDVLLDEIEEGVFDG